MMNDDLPPPEGDDGSSFISGYEALLLKAAEKNARLIQGLRKTVAILGPVANLAMDGSTHANGCPAFSMAEDGGLKVVAPESCVCTLRPILLAYREANSTLFSITEKVVTAED